MEYTFFSKLIFSSGDPDDVIKKIKFSIFTGIPSCDTSMFKGDKYEYFSEKIIKKYCF